MSGAKTRHRSGGFAVVNSVFKIGRQIFPREREGLGGIRRVKARAADFFQKKRVTEEDGVHNREW